MAYNPDSARAFGLCWKLAYAFDGTRRPQLQVFVDDEQSRDGEWTTYGAPPGEATTLTFRGLGDAQQLTLGGSSVTVRFEAVGERTVDYPNGGPEQVPVFTFVIERVG
jgi:hypothetical protein